MADITLFELHLDDAQFTGRAEASSGSPLSGLLGSSEEERSTAGESAESGASSSDSSPLPAIAGLVVLAGVALVARRLLSRGDVEEELERTEPIEVE